MDELTNLDLAAARAGLRQKEFSASELITAHINNMENSRKLNAVVLEAATRALEMAAVCDTQLTKNLPRPLEGLPIGVKDLFCTKDMRTTACSNIFQNFIPSYESHVTQNLWDDGAVLLGKLNNDEFAMGSSNETSRFGAVINPWRALGEDVDLVAGGSSGGSAAAVAAHIGVGAVGTDTGGSIRQPAAFTGTVGLKPTYGRCSRWGIVAFASSLDQAGPIARSVRDCAIMLSSMAGYDARDATSIDRPVPDYEAALTGDIRGLRVGVPKEYQTDDMPADIEKLLAQAIDWLRQAGAEIIDVSLPHTKYALPSYYIIAPAEASSNLARYDGVRYGARKYGETIEELYENTRGAGFGDEVKRRILIGTYVLSAGYYEAYYIKALKIRSLIAQDFARVYEKCDILVSPATPSAAFAIGSKLKDPISMYLSDVFTVPASLAGLPAICVPAGLSEQGLPLGVQIIGRAFEEETILRSAAVLEKAANFQALAKPRVAKKWWVQKDESK